MMMNTMQFFRVDILATCIVLIHALTHTHTHTSGDAVLACAGLGDDLPLAQTLRQKSLWGPIEGEGWRVVKYR